MAAPVKPALKRAFARDRWLWVPAIDDITAPTAAEIQAATGINLSCYALGDQASPTAATEKTSLPRRNCETDVPEVNGATTHSLPEFLFLLHPQAAALSDGKKAWESIDDLEDGFMVRGQDLDPMVDFAAGEFVDVWPAEASVKVPDKTSTGADGVYVFRVGFSVTDTPAFNKAIVA